jgi:glycosyltransferase involved in cell wall biosynthesis
LETAVSSVVDCSESEETAVLQKDVAFKRFKTKLLPFKRKTTQEQIAEIQKSATMTPGKIEDEYMKTLVEWANEGRLAYATHYLKSGHSVPEAVHKILGDKVKFFVHLHCLADLYFGDLNRTYLNSKQEQLRNNLDMMRNVCDPEFIAVSDAVKRSFTSHGVLLDYKISVVRNGVSSDLYDIVSPEDKKAFKRDLGINADVLAGYVGRLDHIKGAENLLAILKYFNNNPKDIGFVIATSGSLKKGLEDFVGKAKALAPRLFAENKIKFCLDAAKLTAGFLSKDQLAGTHFYSVLQNPNFCDVLTKPLHPYLDVYVHPANSEALSLSVIEAAMSGVPVVASNVGGIPEVVNYNNARLIDITGRTNEQAVEFGRAIKYWADHPLDPELAKIYRNNLISAGFDAKTMAQKLDALYEANSK